MEEIKQLIAVLYDKDASEAEKDDAIIDLSDYDAPFVEEALVKAAQELNLSDMLLSSIGESLANIWNRKKNVDINKLHKLPSLAYKEALKCIDAKLK